MVDDRPGAKARGLIAQMRTSGDYQPDEIVAAATASQQAGEFADAYLLFFFAARQGHSGAAMTLGRQADPAHHRPGQSVFDAPDLMQAHKWYEAAARSGNDEARQALAELRERVDRLAASGDPAAQRIALMWQ
jgi:TPR repeat protein